MLLTEACSEASQAPLLLTVGIDSLPDDKIVDWSKLKQIANDILRYIQNGKKVSYRVENIVRKGEIACYKKFLLFLQCFPQLYIFGASKCGTQALKRVMG